VLHEQCKNGPNKVAASNVAGPNKVAVSNVAAKSTCLDQLQQSVQVPNCIYTAAHLYCFRYFGAEFHGVILLFE